MPGSRASAHMTGKHCLAKLGTQNYCPVLEWSLGPLAPGRKSRARLDPGLCQAGRGGEMRRQKRGRRKVGGGKMRKKVSHEKRKQRHLFRLPDLTRPMVFKLCSLEAPRCLQGL